jgi:hypothetical protein
MACVLEHAIAAAHYFRKKCRLQRPLDEAATLELHLTGRISRAILVH